MKYIIYNVQDYGVLYNNAVRLVIFKGLYFTHMLKTLSRMTALFH